MTIAPRYPSLYQLNTRVWLRRLSRERDKRVTLAEIDDATIDGFARQGFDWIWLLSVWRTGPAGRAVSRSRPEWRAEFSAVLPDLEEDDICGSGFAITGYTVSDEIGGEAALAQFRERLARRDIKLMLDFVPNHTAPDHPWVKSNPDYYVQGGEEQIGGAPQNYMRVDTDRGPQILAHGRDPNYPGWPDTLQLDYANPQLQNGANRRIDRHRGQMRRRSLRHGDAGSARGFPAHLGRRPGALLGRRRRRRCAARIRPSPSWRRSIGTSNGRCSSRASTIATTRGSMIGCSPAMSDPSATTFAPVSTTRTSSPDSWRTTTSPAPRPHSNGRSIARRRRSLSCRLGCVFSIRASFEGARVRVPAHLCRGPAEPSDQETAAFYGKLLLMLKDTDAFRNGDWSQIDPLPAWPGNLSSERLRFLRLGGKGRSPVRRGYKLR